MPWLDTSPVRSARFRPIYKWMFWLLVVACFVLGYVGANPPEGSSSWSARSRLLLLLHFLILMPLLGKLERPRPLPASIGTPVLRRRCRRWAAPRAPMEKP